MTLSAVSACQTMKASSPLTVCVSMPKEAPGFANSAKKDSKKRPDLTQAFQNAVLRTEDRVFGVVGENLFHVALAKRLQVMVEYFFG